MGGQLPHETTTMLSVRKHLMVNIIKKYCVCNGNIVQKSAVSKEIGRSNDRRQLHEIKCFPIVFALK